MKKTVVILTIIVGLAVLWSASFAGRNAGGYANLTWVLGNHVRYTPLPVGTQSLFLRLEGISEVVGVEYAMDWSPAGPLGSGCFELIDVSAPIGTDCIWLNRGVVVFGLEDIQDSRVEAAFAGSDWVSVCTGGQVASMLFDFSACPPEAFGWFCLDYCKTTDHYGMIDDMIIVGGNPGWSCAYTSEGPIAVEPVTWGSVKALYQ
jgi:hypothetical protein